MTERVGLLGWPVAHSVSPAMHQAAFAARGLDWRYDLLPTPPERFASDVAAWLAQGYRGFNVTVPHKQAAFRLPRVTAISPAAQAIGAVNTLTVRPDGSLAADNTDWQGFAGDVQAHGVGVQGATCLVLGTGGSARAVAYALRELGAGQVIQVSRNPGGQKGIIGYETLPTVARRAALVVNCTPVGMHPHVDASPWPKEVTFPPDAVLYDLVYNPPVTRLMATARAAGAQAIGGLGMLVRQGALAFEQWVGHTPPLAIMTEAARRALEDHVQEDRKA